MGTHAKLSTIAIVLSVLVILGIILWLFIPRQEEKTPSFPEPPMTKEEVREELVEYFKNKEDTPEQQEEKRRIRKELVDYFSQKQNL